MTDDSATVHIDFESINLAEHLARSALACQRVKAIGSALKRPASNVQDCCNMRPAWRSNRGCGMKRGLAAFRPIWQRPIRAALGGRTSTTERFLSDGDRAACSAGLAEMQERPLMRITPAARRVRNPSRGVWRAGGGRIADHPVFADFPAVDVQLGHDVFGDGDGATCDRNEREPPRPSGAGEEDE